MLTEIASCGLDVLKEVMAGVETVPPSGFMSLPLASAEEAAGGEPPAEITCSLAGGVWDRRVGAREGHYVERFWRA